MSNTTPKSESPPKEGAGVQALVGMQYINRKFAKLQMDLRFEDSDEAYAAAKGLQKFVTTMKYKTSHASMVLEHEEPDVGMKRSRSVTFKEDVTNTPASKIKKEAPSSAGSTPFPKKENKSYTYPNGEYFERGHFLDLAAGYKAAGNTKMHLLYEKLAERAVQNVTVPTDQLKTIVAELPKSPEPQPPLEEKSSAVSPPVVTSPPSLSRSSTIAN